jgi:CRISPR-associated exonuclease Cas4
MFNTGSPWYAAFVVLIAVFLLMAARFVRSLFPKRITKRRPSPPGFGWKIIYTDNAPAHTERKPGVTYGKLLTSSRLNLQGKPDFIYSDGRRLLPVELKSGQIGESDLPRDGDLMQLAVYFELIEAEYNVKPKKGLLIYKDAMFVVKNSGWLRKRLERQLEEMEYMLTHPPGADEETADFVKCRHCPCRGTVCEANE